VAIELDDLRQYLTQRQVRFNETAVQSGLQIKCSGGEIFVHYPRRNKVVVQGNQASELAQAITQWDASGFAPGTIGTSDSDSATNGAQGSRPLSKDVFVVYGHDTDAREKLELLLHRMDLNPIVLANLPAAGDTIIEKLEQYLGERSNVGFACVLLTPDDEGHAQGQSEARRYRARQNVVLELGMVLARLGRRRVAILHKGSVELPSDIAGLVWIPFQERVDEAAGALFKELEAAGYKAKLPG
jgi:predicted nucleotide-binding protein